MYSVSSSWARTHKVKYCLYVHLALFSNDSMFKIHLLNYKITNQ